MQPNARHKIQAVSCTLQSRRSGRRCLTRHSPKRSQARAKAAGRPGGWGSGAQRLPAAATAARGLQHRAAPGGAARLKWRREARPERAARERACAAAPSGAFAPRAWGSGEPGRELVDRGFESGSRLPAGPAAWFAFLLELCFNLFVLVLASRCFSFAFVCCRCNV